MCRFLVALLIGCVASCSVMDRREPAAVEFVELRRFAAPEARQAVAVDHTHFYAIGSRQIAKYDKETGERVGHWIGDETGAIRHLNSGVVIDGTLYCAHSNYPDVPMQSSIEMFDAETLRPLGSHPLESRHGSATVVARMDGKWTVVLANYDGRGGAPGRGSESTLMAWFDQDWRPAREYRFPAAVVERLDGMSISGGSWGRDGKFYATGHDRGEIYVLAVPSAGQTLELEDIVPIANEGQGVAWDPDTTDHLYAIARTRAEVIVFRAVPPPH